MANRTARRYRDERDKNLVDKAELARAKYDAQAAGELVMAAEKNAREACVRADAAEQARDAIMRETERMREDLHQASEALAQATRLLTPEEVTQ